MNFITTAGIIAQGEVIALVSVQYPELKFWALFGASLQDGGSPLSRRDSRY